LRLFASTGSYSGTYSFRRAGGTLAAVSHYQATTTETREVEMNRFFGGDKKVCLRCGRNFNIFNQSLGDLFSTCTTCRLSSSRY
jgi:hypothetical protein